MKLVIGWRTVSNRRGFVNEVTGETLKVVKAEFGDHYHLLLFTSAGGQTAEGTKVSPEFVTESKATDYAMVWMAKHPKGTI